MDSEKLELAEEELISHGMIALRKEDDGSTTCIVNMQFILDLAEFMGEIPLSQKMYKKIKNKKGHPREIINGLIMLLAFAFIEYYKKRDINLLSRDKVEATDYDNCMMFLKAIEKVYSISPIRRAETPDFYWFVHDAYKIKELKKIAEGNEHLFPNYTKEDFINNIIIKDLLV